MNTYIFLCLLCLVEVSHQDLFKLVSQQDFSYHDSNALYTTSPESAERLVKRQATTLKNTEQQTNPSLIQPRECGISAKMTGTVKTNEPSDSKDWPWIAALLHTNNFLSFCGGVLLNRNYVLTAAHCVYRFTVKDMYVRLGEYDFFEQNDTVYIDYAPIEIKVHPEYDAGTQRHDIALLKLNDTVKYTDFIRPICLPTITAKTNQTAIVAGWGTLYYGGPWSNVLMEVPIPVWDLKNCTSRYSQPVFDTNICAAAYEGGKDSCQGDSGGPLLMQQSNGRWANLGVVSWGVSCGEENQPGIYTNVALYLQWIMNNMKDAKM